MNRGDRKYSDNIGISGIHQKSVSSLLVSNTRCNNAQIGSPKLNFCIGQRLLRDRIINSTPRSSFFLNAKKYQKIFKNKFKKIKYIRSGGSYGSNNAESRKHDPSGSSK